MFFCIPKQIQESKRRNSQQISATFRVVNAKIIGILCNNNCCRRFFTQFYDRIIIRNWRAFSVFDFYKDIFRVGVVHHNINFFALFSTSKIAHRSSILIIKRCDMLVNSRFNNLSHLNRVRQNRIIHQNSIPNCRIGDINFRTRL